VGGGDGGVVRGWEGRGVTSDMGEIPTENHNQRGGGGDCMSAGVTGAREGVSPGVRICRGLRGGRGGGGSRRRGAEGG